MIDRGKQDILGVRIDTIDYAAAVEKIITAARHRRPLAVSALAVHGVMTGVLDPEHRHRLNQFDLLVPDGQPVRWALNALHRARLKERVYGPTLMLRTCQRAAEEGLPILLYGGTAELLKALGENLAKRFPGLRIAELMPSRFRRLTEAERDETVTAIRASGAAITFVGLGCPRQEVWAFEMRQALSMPVLAVGAAFNFHAGLLPQAPGWLQTRGLEWLYRFLKEPRRLWKRYLLLNPLYLALLFMQLTGMCALNPHRTLPPREEVRPG
jgi:N-acetylglucosaminyldiphosphoundecaprenol N-acetyl-beta-D-mannosaminyltransferase